MSLLKEYRAIELGPKKKIDKNLTMKRPKNKGQKQNKNPQIPPLPTPLCGKMLGLGNPILR